MRKTKLAVPKQFHARSFCFCGISSYFFLKRWIPIRESRSFFYQVVVVETIKRKPRLVMNSNSGIEFVFCPLHGIRGTAPRKFFVGDRMDHLLCRKNVCHQGNGKPKCPPMAFLFLFPLCNRKYRYEADIQSPFFELDLTDTFEILSCRFR